MIRNWIWMDMIKRKDKSHMYGSYYISILPLLSSSQRTNQMYRRSRTNSFAKYDNSFWWNVLYLFLIQIYEDRYKYKCG